KRAASAVKVKLSALCDSKILSRKEVKPLIALLTIVSLTLPLTLSFKSAAQSDPIAWHGKGWKHRMGIILDLKKITGFNSGLLLPIELSDLNLRSVNFGGHVATDDGGDLLFLDSKGGKLAHEIEAYDPKTGSLTAWLKLGPVSSVNPKFLLYYANPNCADQFSKGLLAAGQKMVDHMNLPDLTSGKGGPKTVSGGLGLAKYFDGEASLLNLGPDSSLSLMDGGLIEKNGTPLEGFETTSNWSVGGKMASQALDTANLLQGKASLKLTSSGGNLAYLDKKISLASKGASNMSIWVYVYNLESLRSLALSLSSTENFSKSLSATIPASALNEGWNHLLLGRGGDFTSSAKESWDSQMVALRVACKSTSSQSSSVSFDDLKINYKSRAKAAITFDDGCDGVKEKAFPIMKANGQKGVAFIVTDYVGGGAHMSKDELKEMKDFGWDISNHTKNHPQLTSLSPSALASNINEGYDWLARNGFKESAKFFAYPYGLYDERVIVTVAERHEMARTTKDGSFQPNILPSGDLKYLVKGFYVTNTTSVASIKKAIDEAIEKGSFINFTFHQIVDEKADLSTRYLTSNFKEVSDYLKSKSSQIDVVTYSDYQKAMELSEKFTIELYLKPDAWSDGRVLLEQYHPLSNRVPISLIAKSGGRDFSFKMTGDNGLSDSLDLSLGSVPAAKYTHLVFSYDGEMIRAYKDGRFADQASLKGELLNNHNPLTFGGRDFALWKGSLDEIRIYRQALSAEEAETLYRLQTDPKSFFQLSPEERST
ncbi:MAG: polysaccharide deacetylase family protein, partial [Actinomycetota bacterium]|nr:polysaccharide deacetylase family protein [Actinomycetota bacterium]